MTDARRSQMKKCLGLLRELEIHLAAMEITAQSGVLPMASAICAGDILREALAALGQKPAPDVAKLLRAKRFQP